MFNLIFLLWVILKIYLGCFYWWAKLTLFGFEKPIVYFFYYMMMCKMIVYIYYHFYIMFIYMMGNPGMLQSMGLQRAGHS